MDATYNINKYKIPLLIFTGIASDGRNLCFGIACINNETAETYSGALKSFFAVHKSRPKLIVTDGGSTCTRKTITTFFANGILSEILVFSRKRMKNFLKVYWVCLSISDQKKFE